MENATKALLLAGGVLITIIVISLGLALYGTFSSQTRGYSQVISSTQIQKFNSKFLVFLGREDITAMEVVTAINLGKQNNVRVLVNNENKITSNEEFLEKHGDNIYKCEFCNEEDKLNPLFGEDGRIKQITFKLNS